MDWPIVLSATGLVAALTALSIIDARTMRLPDILTLPLIGAGLLAAWVFDQPVWLHGSGAVLGYLVLVAIEVGYLRVRGRAGLGRGDAKLFAAGGAWCGAFALPLILLIASASALVYVLAARIVGGKAVKPDMMIAFGPFLSFAIALVYALEAAGLTRFAGF